MEETKNMNMKRKILSLYIWHEYFVGISQISKLGMYIYIGMRKVENFAPRHYYKLLPKLKKV